MQKSDFMDIRGNVKFPFFQNCKKWYPFLSSQIKIDLYGKDRSVVVNKSFFSILSAQPQKLVTVGDLSFTLVSMFVVFLTWTGVYRDFFQFSKTIIFLKLYGRINSNNYTKYESIRTKDINKRSGASSSVSSSSSSSGSGTSPWTNIGRSPWSSKMGPRSIA